MWGVGTVVLSRVFCLGGYVLIPVEISSIESKLRFKNPLKEKKEGIIFNEE